VNSVCWHIRLLPVGCAVEAVLYRALSAFFCNFYFFKTRKPSRQIYVFSEVHCIWCANQASTSLQRYSLSCCVASVVLTKKAAIRPAGAAASVFCLREHAYVVLLHFLHGAVICVPVFIWAERSIWLRVFHRPPVDTSTRFFVLIVVCGLFLIHTIILICTTEVSVSRTLGQFKFTLSSCLLVLP